MKTIKKLLLSLFAFSFFGCCSSSLPSSKNPFGEIPKLFAKLETDGYSLRNVPRKDITPELIKKVQDKTQSVMVQIEEETRKIIGNKVPFSGDPFKLLQIEDVVIADATTNSNECYIDIKVLCKPKKEITLVGSPNAGSYYKFTSQGESEADATCSLYAMQYAVFIDNEGKIIDYKKIHPFVSDKYDFQYNIGSKITPSQYCNDKGSTFHIQLPRVNFVDFKEIRFITETELQELLNNIK